MNLITLNLLIFSYCSVVNHNNISEFDSNDERILLDGLLSIVIIQQYF